jgi:hypothetical protein
MPAPDARASEKVSCRSLAGLVMHSDKIQRHGPSIPSKMPQIRAFSVQGRSGSSVGAGFCVTESLICMMSIARRRA